jgi:thiol:disulfide interchange protein DsbD
MTPQNSPKVEFHFPEEIRLKSREQRVEMKMMRLTVILSIWICSSLGFATNVEDEKPLQAQGRLAPIELSPQQGAEVRIELHLPDGYRAYSDMFRLSVPTDSGFQVGSFHISPLHDFYDENTKKKKKGVIQNAVMTAPLEAPKDFKNEKSPLLLKLTYQACTKTYCLFPTTIEVPVEFKVAGASQSIPPAPSLSITDFFKKPFHEVLRDQSLLFILLILFAAGFLTSLTPCVFPMIPITMAVIGREAHARTKWQTFFVSLVYVLGIALTYSILGVFAASTGVLFGSFMSSTWVLAFVCLVFFLMSLSMFGLYDLQLPTFVQNRISHARFQGYWGVFLTGAMAGVVASPCVGPVLVGILTYIAQTKNLWTGFWSLFVFALGMGQIFLILGVFSSATRLLPKSGAWMDGVKHFFGLLMLFGFYYYLNFLIPTRWFDASLGLGAILLGSLKGAFEHPLTTPWQKIRKGLCQALIIVGAFQLITAIFDNLPWKQPRMISETAPIGTEWKPYSDALLEKARVDGKPVLIDFSADWCAACKELEQYTFADPKFKEATKDFVLLRFDATNDSPELEKLRKKYDIIGLPTVVIHDSTGKWREELTVVAFEETAGFLERFQKLKVGGAGL